jgi:hypothetical protein
VKIWATALIVKGRMVLHTNCGALPIRACLRRRKSICRRNFTGLTPIQGICVELPESMVKCSYESTAMGKRKKTPAVLNAHTKRRAEERYGISLNKDDRRSINQKIQTNQAEYVGRSSNTRSLWKVEHEGQTLNVVYDKLRHTCATALPQNAHEFTETMDTTNTFLCSATPEEGPATKSARASITDELSRLWLRDDE